MELLQIQLGLKLQLTKSNEILINNLTMFVEVKPETSFQRKLTSFDKQIKNILNFKIICLFYY